MVLISGMTLDAGEAFGLDEVNSFGDVRWCILSKPGAWLWSLMGLCGASRVLGNASDVAFSLGDDGTRLERGDTLMEGDTYGMGGGGGGSCEIWLSEGTELLSELLEGGFTMLAWEYGPGMPGTYGTFSSPTGIRAG